ncbi:sigma factor-like helix-turn-helix DNA-binding protein [Neobacillus pocheonensis]|uniref:sigma factor-like helix-turn-helix DNA-binding protein n=1 Tax=Neobacillus pocheonensis TaxID=363869 RepID=UPI003D2B876E
MSHVLNEREQIILNEMYGVNKERTYLKTVAELLNLSPERVRQLRNRAEYKMIRRLLVRIKDESSFTEREGQSRS